MQGTSQAWGDVMVIVILYLVITGLSLLAGLAMMIMEMIESAMGAANIRSFPPRDKKRGRR